MPNYEEIITQSQKNVTDLSAKLKDLEELHRDIKTLANSNRDIPTLFNQAYIEIRDLTKRYTNDIATSAEVYLSGNNEIFVNNFKVFDEKIADFENELIRLEKVNLQVLFEEAREIFLNNTSKELAIEYEKIDAKTGLLKNSISEFQQEISRLKEIDLIEAFKDLQKTFINKTTAELAIEYKKLDAKSKALKVVVTEFQQEVKRLTAVDLNNLFVDLQKDFIDKTGEDLAGEYKKLDASKIPSDF